MSICKQRICKLQLLLGALRKQSNLLIRYSCCLTPLKARYFTHYSCCWGPLCR